MANYRDIIANAAALLISSVSVGVAVYTTDINKAVQELNDRNLGYPQSKIEDDLRNEVKKERSII